jgi:uncharacterized protein (DUF697 family)/predicted GTPase
VAPALWNSIAEALFKGPQDNTLSTEVARTRAQGVAPVVWLLGKTGAGKTAIVSALTGDTRAAVGEGFTPCTRTASFFDVPPEAPLLRFLDTRGLAEANYDAATDIAWCEQQSHLLLVAMQVSDPSQEAVLAVLHQARRRHPDWPVIVAQTGLHRLYSPGAAHTMPYPFSGGVEDETNAALPHRLRQGIAYQRRMFSQLRGAAPLFVAVDFTQPEDGYEPQHYGLDALLQAIEIAAPAAFEALHLTRADDEMGSIHARMRGTIYGYGTASAGAGAVPVPLVGVSGLAGVLALMLRTLANAYNVAWTPRTFAEFSGVIGGGTLTWWMVRYGFRELLKLVPVLGTSAASVLNAASAFAVTVGIGEAACVWLGYKRRGLMAPSDEVRRAFSEGLAAGLRKIKSNPPAVA